MKGKIAQVISILAAAMILFGAAAQPSRAGATVREPTSEQVADRPTGAIDFRRPSAHASCDVLCPLGAQVAVQPTGAIDPRELEAFVDGLMAAEMAAKHIPGATVAVVQDGRLLLAKGYGYADLENRVPVDPERTLFRVGSVSKLFTWTAVMQLVEQGRLDLDADVNEYLDFEIPATFAEPITMRHLMSHTPGFEDGNLTMEKLDAGQVSPLDDYLKTNLPARIFPPGQVSAYSNYGTALAGYAVERVSGLPFYEYVEQHIFAPLGMDHSTFLQPLPEPLAADLATGYNYVGGQYVTGPFIFDQAYPAGSMSTTAADVARFMIAHLQDGELDGQRLLQAETARRMHSRLYTPDPRLKGGIAHGFFDETANGQRLLSHTGNMTTHLSGLYLIPGQNVGLFIVANSTGSITTLEAVKKAFLDRTYPAAEPSALQSAAGFAERIAPYLGEYTWSRTNFTTLEKMGVLMRPTRIRLPGWRAGPRRSLACCGWPLCRVSALPLPTPCPAWGRPGSITRPRA